MSGRPLKISVVTSLYPSPPRPREGIFAEQRWVRLAERGHQVSVVHPQPLAPPFASGAWGEIRKMPATEMRSGLEVRRPRYLHLPGRAVGNSRRFARAAWSALGGRDVVVCDYAWPASAIAPYCKAVGIPCLVNGRGSDVLQVQEEQDLKSLLQQYLAQASHWCAVSQDLVRAMDSLAGHLGRGVLVPNGVDQELCRPRDREQCRSQLGLQGAAPVVLVVGHLIPRKDPMLALEAFQRGAPPEALLRFIGRGPLHDRLQARLQELGLEQRVELLGECPPETLALWLGASHLLLLTSSREGRPNVVLEALASGRPVVATEAGGTAELLHDSSMLCSSRDAEELGAHIRRALEHEWCPEELSESVACFSWDASLDALECLLLELSFGGMPRV